MPDGQVLEFTRVTKRFNDVTAVSDFSARVEPGVVTAFLGPNGAGKTTTLRILLGQVRPTSGTATIGGVAYADLRTPLRVIGSVLEETVYRPRRTANRQLTIAAKANGIPLSRVDEVLALVGLENEGEGRIGSFSLGMRQRLSVAHALLGDPGTLVFDEPANGLDPEGIRWMRLLMRRLADEGRTVIVSSHVLSEVEQVADHVLVLSKGQLVLSSGIETLADPSSGAVVVDAADRAALRSALAHAGFEVEVLRSGLTVRGTDAGTVGAVAASAGVALTTLVQRGPTLEDVFIELVRGGGLEPRAQAAASELALPPVEPADATAPVPVPADAAAPVPVPADAAAPVPVPADAAAPAPAQETPVAGIGSDDGFSPADEASDTAVDLATEPPTEAEPSEGSAPAPDPASPSAADANGGASDDAVEQTPSFDDILFGSGQSTPDASTEEPNDAPSDSGEEHSGIEVFSDLAGAEPDASATDDAEISPATDAVDGAEGADPRAAAVSSMLAAAARAYYDDEPRPYPLADASAEGDSDTAESGQSDDDGDRTDAAAESAVESESAGGPENTDGSEDTDDATAIIDVVPVSSQGDDSQTAPDGPSHEAERAADDEPSPHEGEHEGQHEHEGQPDHEGHGGEHEGQPEHEAPHDHDGDHRQY